MIKIRTWMDVRTNAPEMVNELQEWYSLTQIGTAFLAWRRARNITKGEGLHPAITANALIYNWTGGAGYPQTPNRNNARMLFDVYQVLMEELEKPVNQPVHPYLKRYARMDTKDILRIRREKRKQIRRSRRRIR